MRDAAIRRLLLAGWIGAALFLFPSAASAHLLVINCFRDAGGLEIEVYYSGGAAVAGARVKVLTEPGAVIAEGVSGADGKFRCPAPEGTALAVEAVFGGDRTLTSITPDGLSNMSSSQHQPHLDGTIWSLLLGTACICLASWLARKLLHRIRPRAKAAAVDRKSGGG